MKKTIPLLVMFIALAGVTVTNAQSEFFVKVNPDSGTFSNIKLIPGVNLIAIGASSCSAVDRINNRYFFEGNDSAGLFHLYTLDANSGSIIYAPYFPHLIDSSDAIGELQYDDSAMTLYGLYWKTSTQTEYFVSVDIITGAIAFIDSLSGVNSIGIGVYTYDQNNHTYIFLGSDAGGTNYLYSVQSGTGNILFKPVSAVNSVSMIRYDNSSNILYGNLSGRLFKINPSTANTTAVANITGITSFAPIPNYTTFDEINHRYILGGSDSTGVFRLYSIDVLTGNVISNPAFPIGLNAGENVIELNFDNNSGILYALHWGAEPVSGINDLKPGDNIVSCFPNPFSNSITFYLPQKYHQSLINIYSPTGQLVRREERTDMTVAIVNRGTLQDGAYLFEVTGDGQTIARGTIVIQ